MSGGIESDRTPDEVFLQIFDGFTFNELRPILGTSSRWRALAQACPAFWRDILTPRSSAAASLGAAIGLACTRISRTNGRHFTLHLRGAHPDVLSAAMQHIHHVEHLDVQLADVEEITAVLSALNTVTAPCLRTLNIKMQDEDDVLSPPVSPPVLQPELFSGTGCPLLTRLSLSDIALPPSEVLLCLSGVTELRFWPTADLLSPITPDINLHFPALRRLSLSAPVGDIGSGFDEEQLEIIRWFRTADYSRLEYVELLEDCWDLAEETSWPLEIVPHVLVDNSECTSFPFLPPIALKPGHLVFEPDAAEEGACVIRFGSDDWTFSRGCVSNPWPGGSDSRGTHNAACFDFQLGADVAEAVQTVSVPASLVSLARFVLDQASNITTLRIIVGPRGTLPNMDGLYRLRSPKIRALVLRADFDPHVSARVDYDALVLFVSSAFEDADFTVSLVLENVELCGERPQAFVTYFSDVETQDPEAWSSYLNARGMLNRFKDW